MKLMFVDLSGDLLIIINNPRKSQLLKVSENINYENCKN